MQRYNINNRLAYLSSGVQSASGMWPSAASANWWDVPGETCIAAYQPKGAASLAASYSNLANPGTADMAPGVAPTFDTGTGWTFNGTTQWLRATGLTIPVGGTLIVRSTLGGTGARVASATYGDALQFAFALLSTTTLRLYSGGQFVNGTVTAGTNTVVAIANNIAYINGSSVGSPITPSNTTDSTYINVGAWYPGFGPFNYAAADVAALAAYSTGLDATQISDLTDAMNAL